MVQLLAILTRSASDLEASVVITPTRHPVSRRAYVEREKRSIVKMGMETKGLTRAGSRPLISMLGKPPFPSLPLIPLSHTLVSALVSMPAIPRTPCCLQYSSRVIFDR